MQKLLKKLSRCDNKHNIQQSKPHLQFVHCLNNTPPNKDPIVIKVLLFFISFIFYFQVKAIWSKWFISPKRIIENKNLFTILWLTPLQHPDIQAHNYLPAKRSTALNVLPKLKSLRYFTCICSQCCLCTQNWHFFFFSSVHSHCLPQLDIEQRNIPHHPCFKKLFSYFFRNSEIL